VGLAVERGGGLGDGRGEEEQELKDMSSAIAKGNLLKKTVSSCGSREVSPTTPTLTRNLLPCFTSVAVTSYLISAGHQLTGA
jgi:hypothetical protein